MTRTLRSEELAKRSVNFSFLNMTHNSALSNLGDKNIKPFCEPARFEVTFWVPRDLGRLIRLLQMAMMLSEVSFLR